MLSTKSLGHLGHRNTSQYLQHGPVSLLGHAQLPQHEWECQASSEADACCNDRRSHPLGKSRWAPGRQAPPRGRSRAWCGCRRSTRLRPWAASTSHRFLRDLLWAYSWWLSRWRYGSSFWCAGNSEEVTQHVQRRGVASQERMDGLRVCLLAFRSARPVEEDPDHGLTRFDLRRLIFPPALRHIVGARECVRGPRGNMHGMILCAVDTPAGRLTKSPGRSSGGQ